MLPAPFLGTVSAMAKSADDMVRSLIKRFRSRSLADAIRDYFKDCSLREAEKVGSINKGFLETGT